MLGPLKLNWNVIGAAAGIAAQAIVVVWIASAQFSDVRSDVALVRQEVSYLRRDIDRLDAKLEKSNHASVGFSLP